MEQKYLHLSLYGRIAWRTGSTIAPLPPGKPTSMAVMLAEAKPGWVSVDRLLDSLWDTPPRSGANAVQRHVSRLRSQLRQLDIAGVSGMIETSAAGYRLGPEVSTDLDLIDDVAAMTVPEPGGDLPPFWWEEPLVGVRWEGNEVLRSCLIAAASRLRRRWVSEAASGTDAGRTARRLESMVMRNPQDEDTLLLLLEVAEATADAQTAHEVAEVLSSAVSTVGHREPVSRRVSQLIARLAQQSRSGRGYQLLGPCEAAWRAEDLDAAFEALDLVSSEYSPDVIHRVGRCLTWIPVDDGWGRTMWNELVSMPVFMADLAERALVSLDAFALEQVEQSIATADLDVKAARSDDELLRSLRVRFMVGMGHPISARQLEVVAQLAELDSPAARTESLRFGAMLATKRGRFSEALRGFAEFQELTELLLPDSVDDFAQLARFVLYQSAKHSDHGEPILATSLMPILTNQFTAEMATLWKLLLDGHETDTSVVKRMLQMTISATPFECGAAYQLFWHMRQDSDGSLAEQAQELLRYIRGRPNNRHRHTSLAVLGRFAIENDHREIATELVELLEPWRGEQLGIWPLDVVFGPADDLLASLSNVIA